MLLSVLCITTNKCLVCVLVVLLNAHFSVVGHTFSIGCLFFLRVIPMYTSNKSSRCRDGKTTGTRIGMEGICITHSCIPLYTVYLQVHSITHLTVVECRNG